MSIIKAQVLWGLRRFASAYRVKSLRLDFMSPCEMLRRAKVMPASNSLMISEIDFKAGLDNKTLSDKVIKIINK